MRAGCLAQPGALQSTETVSAISAGVFPGILSSSHTLRIPCHSAGRLVPGRLNGVTPKQARLGETGLVFLELGGAGTRPPGPPAPNTGVIRDCSRVGRVQTGEALSAQSWERRSSWD